MTSAERPQPYREDAVEEPDRSGVGADAEPLDELVDVDGEAEDTEPELVAERAPRSRGDEAEELLDWMGSEAGTSPEERAMQMEEEPDRASDDDVDR